MMNSAQSNLSSEDRRARWNCADMLDSQADEWRDARAQISDVPDEQLEDNARDCEFTAEILRKIGRFGHLRELTREEHRAER